MFTSGEAKVLELSVWGIVLVEEMHTPETKKYHFSKNSPAVVNYLVISRIKCLLLGQKAPISYDFHLEQADIILLGMRI